MWTSAQKLLKISRDAGEKEIQEQKGRALVKCEFLGLTFRVGPSKGEKWWFV